MNLYDRWIDQDLHQNGTIMITKIMILILSLETNLGIITIVVIINPTTAVHLLRSVVEEEEVEEEEVGEEKCRTHH